MLTANLTTPDGVNHPAAHALVYPLTLTNLSDVGDVSVSCLIHCWHSADARLNGAEELSGFPASITWTGAEAGALLVAALSGLAEQSFSGTAEEKATAAQAFLVDQVEQSVIARDSRFTQA